MLYLLHGRIGFIDIQIHTCQVHTGRQGIRVIQQRIGEERLAVVPDGCLPMREHPEENRSYDYKAGQQMHRTLRDRGFFTQFSARKDAEIQKSDGRQIGVMIRSKGQILIMVEVRESQKNRDDEKEQAERKCTRSSPHHPECDKKDDDRTYG